MKLSAGLLAGVISCLQAYAADAQPASAPSTRFESTADASGKRMVVLCAKVAPGAAVPCSVAESKDASAAPANSQVVFLPLSSRQAYLAELARAAADAQASEPKVLDSIPPMAADVAVLREVVKDPSACLAEKDIADMMLVCPTGRRFEDAVVMLFRGLGARSFEPIVVRKVN
ncbi:hypothetical protein [Roseateles sp. P5_E4]